MFVLNKEILRTIEDYYYIICLKKWEISRLFGLSPSKTSRISSESRWKCDWMWRKARGCRKKERSKENQIKLKITSRRPRLEPRTFLFLLTNKKTEMKSVAGFEPIKRQKATWTPLLPSQLKLEGMGIQEWKQVCLFCNHTDLTNAVIL